MHSHSGYQPLPSSSSPEPRITFPPRPPAVSHRESCPDPSSSSNKRLSSSKVDLGSVEAGLSKWISRVSLRKRMSIRSMKKRRHTGRGQQEAKMLMKSVFGIGGSAGSPLPLASSAGFTTQLMSESQFQEVVTSVQEAISLGIHPKMITKGSSGSYFAVNSSSKIVAVFKPKDEEPYGRLNPKWTKWIHRKLFWWVGFGRACLIPNLSYISEVAASCLDDRLGLGIVPCTRLVSLSSPAFFYDWIDRTAYRNNGKPLREKAGSFQVSYYRLISMCLCKYQDATEWLKKHPWPGPFYDEEALDHHSSRHHLRRCLRAGAMVCGRAGADTWDADGNEYEQDQNSYNEQGYQQTGRDVTFRWTADLKTQFWEELQKLVVLDVLMHNTDRGMDNYMIKYTPATPPAPKFVPTVISEPPSSMSLPNIGKAFQTTSPESTENRPRIQIAAIDNSLSFPHHHPKGWRSYTYGWLYLPVSLIGQPFSESIRKHFIPLFSSPAWWEQTTKELRALFELDSDFSEDMWERQLAVLKGQGYSLLESLKTTDEGPLELCRRERMEVIRVEIEVPDDPITDQLVADTLGSTPVSVDASVETLPVSVRPTIDHRHSSEARLSAGASTFSCPSLASFRPAPISGSPQTVWRGFQGHSGVTALASLDKFDRTQKKRMRKVRKKSIDAGEDESGHSEYSRGAFSDGDDSESSSFIQQSSSSFRFPPSRHRIPIAPRPARGRSFSSSGSGHKARMSLDGIVESSLEGFATPKGMSRSTSSQRMDANDGAADADVDADVDADADEEEDEEVEDEAMTQSLWSIRSLGGIGGVKTNKGKHHRWSSDGGGRPNKLAKEVPTRVVLVERLKPITSTAFFSGW
ncbi:Phosphatidylinositol 4-kinase [Phaffia rhodozyma]|uniref:Phosphatidylinositol 4-kinase n=1 Tax=Phaffia rhodozyma TaxID=264483 RepID=A0A0F7SI89_PHARH|nr:Phosphatidylinositol 4-kinase [Phaffia rhodozyma]